MMDERNDVSSSNPIKFSNDNGKSYSLSVSGPASSSYDNGLGRVHHVSSLPNLTSPKVSSSSTTCESINSHLPSPSSPLSSQINNLEKAPQRSSTKSTKKIKSLISKLSFKRKSSNLRINTESIILPPSTSTSTSINMSPFGPGSTSASGSNTSSFNVAPSVIHGTRSTSLFLKRSNTSAKKSRFVRHIPSLPSFVLLNEFENIPVNGNGRDLGVDVPCAYYSIIEEYQECRTMDSPIESSPGFSHGSAVGGREERSRDNQGEDAVEDERERLMRREGEGLPEYDETFEKLRAKVLKRDENMIRGFELMGL